ncbi:MAG: M48 family metallopeptidase [Bacteroidetes bacterium]|nr:M48 family metallopeptidase [Bacteroidota bacterium]
MIIAGISVEIVQKNIKNIHLAVYPPDGHVRLAAPANVNRKTLELYVTSKLAWIRKQRRKCANQDRQSPRKYVDRETHYVFGRPYLLRVRETNDEHRYRAVRIHGKSYLELFVRSDDGVEEKADLLKEWYRAELKKELAVLISKWERIIGVNARSYRVVSMKTKWGSCNPDLKSININLELAKKPVGCIEYVLAHELLHLIERKHNDAFRQYLDKRLPKWKSIRAELNALPVAT